MTTPLLTTFGGSRHRQLVDDMVASGGWAPFEVRHVRFANGNRMFFAPDSVPRRMDILWSGEFDTGEALLDLALAMDCLWRANPRVEARLIVPYLPYGRSSRVEDRSSLGAAAFLRLLDAVPGIVEYSVFEPHLQELAGFSRRPMRDVPVHQDIAAWASAAGPVDAVVAPDRGRVGSCTALARVLGCPTEVLLKQRTDHGDRAHREFVDRPTLAGLRVLLYDDELTTGATIGSALDNLQACGVKAAYLAVARSFAQDATVAACGSHPLVAGFATTSLTATAHSEAFRRRGLPVISPVHALAELAVSDG